MKPSVEPRWLFRQRLPSEVKDWFCGSRLCKEEALRNDRHLVSTGSNEVGVKVRDGHKFEIEARTRMPEPFSPATGASVGRQDAWVRWSLADDEVAGRLHLISPLLTVWHGRVRHRWQRKRGEASHVEYRRGPAFCRRSSGLPLVYRARRTQEFLLRGHPQTLLADVLGSRHRLHDLFLEFGVV